MLVSNKKIILSNIKVNFIPLLYVILKIKRDLTASCRFKF